MHTRMIKGSQLKPEVQMEALRAFINRFTKEHVPAWALKPRGISPGGTPVMYQPHFDTDAEWLANTEFHVTKDGRLDGRYRSCFSTPVNKLT